MTRVRVDLVITSPAPSRPEWLEPSERVLWQRYRRGIDRDRHFTGLMLRQAVLSQRAGRTVPVRRRCRGCGATDHGEVQPAGADDRRRWSTSLSHCESDIVLAVAERVAERVGDTHAASETDAHHGPHSGTHQGTHQGTHEDIDEDIDVGVDVEAVSRIDEGMARHMLSAGEARQPAPLTPWVLCGIWTAKEAALKAVGCGLHASATQLEVVPETSHGVSTVRPVGTDPRLQSLQDRPSRLIDVTDAVSAAHAGDVTRRAALVVLGTQDVRVDHRWMSADELWSAVS